MHHRFKEERVSWSPVWFDQEEEESRTIEGGKGKEQHDILQQLWSRGPEGQSKESDNKDVARRADTCPRTQGSGGVYRISDDRPLLLCELRSSLWHREGAGRVRKARLVATRRNAPRSSRVSIIRLVRPQDSAKLSLAELGPGYSRRLRQTSP